MVYRWARPSRCSIFHSLARFWSVDGFWDLSAIICMAGYGMFVTSMLNYCIFLHVSFRIWGFSRYVLHFSVDHLEEARPHRLKRLRSSFVFFPPAY